MDELTYASSLPHAVLSFIGWLYLRIAGGTASIREARAASAEVRPVIYALWHEQQAMMTYLNRDRGLCTLVSRSKDGEYMARILMRLGFHCARGSTSSGGPRALRALLKAAEEGYSLAVTPDGPRGPARKAQRGALYLAMKTGRPIVPCACFVSSKLTLASWDKYQLPLPFARTGVVYGAPMRVSPGDDLQTCAAELERRINEATLDAKALVTGKE